METGNSQKLIVTYKYRVKDAQVRVHLNRYARAVNRVWNYCCEVQKTAEKKWRSGRKVNWPTNFDLSNLCGDGLSSILGIHSDTINYTCRQFTASRNHRKICPSFRVSGTNAKRSLGWVPFTKRGIRIEDDHVVYCKQKIRFWKHRAIDGVIKGGAFVEDAQGHWYITFQCEVSTYQPSPASDNHVGIDLGIKDIATLSDGSKVEAMGFFAANQKALAVAHRARNWRRLRKVHAKIKNSRRHHLHVASCRIVNQFYFIAVGNVDSNKLAKTHFAKSVYDSGWGMFKHMLRYKSARRQGVCVIVDESWSTRTCSSCGTIPDSSPKGKSGLGIRHWVCSDCGASHDRDVNAAKNILRVGLERQPPAEGIRVASAKTLQNTFDEPVPVAA